MYILDTNSLSDVLKHGQQTLLGQRLAAVPDPHTNLHITVVTVEEILAGQIKSLNLDPKKVRDLEPLHIRYRWLQEAYDALKEWRPLPFNAAAQAVYDRIPKNIKENARVRDCRIAAIGVATGYTVITANQKDFIRIETAIPVRHEDWTVRQPE